MHDVATALPWSAGPRSGLVPLCVDGRGCHAPIWFWSAVMFRPGADSLRWRSAPDVLPRPQPRTLRALKAQPQRPADTSVKCRQDMPHGGREAYFRSRGWTRGHIMHRESRILCRVQRTPNSFDSFNS